MERLPLMLRHQVRLQTSAAERCILAQAQLDLFPDEVKALKSKQYVPSDSCLATLAPEYDKATGRIRVGGRLCHGEDLEVETIHQLKKKLAHL